MTQDWINALRVADIVFTTLFAVEATNKIIGLREHYFKDPFNVFDFLVVLVSITGNDGILKNCSIKRCVVLNFASPCK